jgi:putative ABC transport system permease protein
VSNVWMVMKQLQSFSISSNLTHFSHLSYSYHSMPDVLMMITIATNEAISRPKYTYNYHPLLTFLTLLITITSVGSFAFFFIIRPTPIWNPQYVIPICGMLMGNIINGVSLSVNNLTTNIMEGGRREVELYLSFGGSGMESVRRLMKGAISTGVTPMINQLNVIGLVSIPGMMTGQILGGNAPPEAARYQILIIWLISTAAFATIIMNAFVVYRVAFDANAHVLRTDRFIEVIRNGKNKGMMPFGSLLSSLKLVVGAFCDGLKSILCCGRGGKDGSADSADIEQQPLSEKGDYGTNGTTNKIQIVSRIQSNTEDTSPFFQISKLQFSVPKSHTKRVAINNTANLEQQQQGRVLCTNLNVKLSKGEIAFVRGPSGAGKSTLLRIISGLTPMDEGDIIADGISVASCLGIDGHHNSHFGMTQWRQSVRYVTQYKVDIPGTPRDFILRMSLFHSFSPIVHANNPPPSAAEMTLQTMAYIQQWGMQSSGGSFSSNHFLNKEWKVLSGGESQRMLLAIALASRPQILLLDESTSGLDGASERKVEDSVLDYVKRWGACVLWVTHSDDIAERMLKS